MSENWALRAVQSWVPAMALTLTKCVHDDSCHQANPCTEPTLFLPHRAGSVSQWRAEQCPVGSRAKGRVSRVLLFQGMWSVEGDLVREVKVSGSRDVSLVLL